ncbi:MBL fold metallo-hydrolase [Blastococcus sp. TF02A-30]|uniref:MBL fold metallo-hydrolase n=1 Tax=Blastococcus sp. TF02A-30 TaxID=2250580 RepID=UPI000DE9B460|nr:MBL fold metallo-hydrolase [Blastococcus sp. TF02A-30]RBY92985.1 MBL fold metallo-hydrolase [Blastococcus sp. TF02A-30]
MAERQVVERQVPERTVPERTVPEPGEVAPGVWSLPLPFPNPLRYTLAYLLEAGSGLVLVDAGWDSEECWAALRRGLALAGAEPADLAGVAITHIHPDHYGLAGRLREHTSAWIGMHPLEADRIPSADEEVAAVLEEMVAWLHAAGAPPDEVQALRDHAAVIAATTPRVRPDRLLHDGQQLPGRSTTTAVHTPGHTRGHLCFVDEAQRIAFTGDHVLPRVTPNISQRPQQGEDPLGHYRRSIAKLRGSGALLGLPGHEWPIPDLDGRIDVLAEHHRDRLDQVEAVLRGGASTVWEVATTISWSRSWDELRGLQRRSALGETHSHLERLVREGRAQVRPGPPDRWSVDEDARAHVHEPAR